MSTFVIIIIGIIGFYLIGKHFDKKEQKEKEERFNK